MRAIQGKLQLLRINPRIDQGAVQLLRITPRMCPRAPMRRGRADQARRQGVALRLSLASSHLSACPDLQTLQKAYCSPGSILSMTFKRVV